MYQVQLHCIDRGLSNIENGKPFVNRTVYRKCHDSIPDHGEAGRDQPGRHPADTPDRNCRTIHTR